MRAVIVLAALAMAACSTTSTPTTQAASSAWDGRWSGTATASGQGCETSLRVEATVTGGRMEGQVIGRSIASFSATILETGEFTDLSVDTTSGATGRGTVSEEEIRGTWRNRYCRGDFTMTRAGL